MGIEEGYGKTFQLTFLLSYNRQCQAAGYIFKTLLKTERTPYPKCQLTGFLQSELICVSHTQTEK